MDGPVAEALALAEAQLQLIEAGDIDGYIAGLSGYGRACGSLEDRIGPADRVDMERLLSLDARMNAVLREAKAEAGRKLGELTRGRTAGSAYLATMAPAKRAPRLEG